MIDKGIVVRIFNENKRLPFRKRVVLIKLSEHDLAGVEFHHEKCSLLDDIQMNDFVEVNFNIKGKVGEEDRLYNNLVGISIKKI